MANFQDLYEAILKGDQKTAIAVAQAAMDEKADIKKVVDEYMITAMDKVGQLFEANEYFVPELLIAARAMKSALAILRPGLKEAGAEPAGTVAIGTVKGDLHDIGKNLVASMLEGAGFEIVDLGVDVAPEQFIQSVKEKGVNVICLSALLTTTMPSMKTTIDAVAAAGLNDKVKVIIGGAPVTQQYADEIGADGYGDNANSAVTVARKLLGK